MEQKFQIGNAWGTILWDVSAMLAQCSAYPIVRCSTEALASQFPFHGDADYATQTRLEKPGILVQLHGDQLMLIDGNHRLRKAVMEKRPFFDCYYLKEEEHIRYIVSYDVQIYRDVVAHWGQEGEEHVYANRRLRSIFAAELP